MRLAADLSDFNIKKKNFLDKKFLNKDSLDQTVLGKENLVFKAFSLTSKNLIFNVKLLTSEMNTPYENKISEPITVEATLLATDLFSKKLKELLLNKYFIEKAQKFTDLKLFKI